MSDPFTPSPELAAIARRGLQAYAARQSTAATNLFSRSKAVTYIGSDEGELFTGDDLHTMFAAFTDDQAKLVPENIEATGFEAGSFGWAYTTLTIHSPEANKRVDFRNTFIFTLEDAVWRIVHVHNSNPKPNLEAMGYTSRSLEDLAAAAQTQQVDIGQTGIASVMFTDIVGSTALAETMGDAAWSRTVSNHLAQITTKVEAVGGTLIKTLGDGTLSTYPSASAALGAAKAIQLAVAASTSEPHLCIRIGVHTGDVVQSDGDFVGSVMNKAARVAAMAAPDEIRVSEATRVMVGTAPGLVFTDPVQVPLKGLDGEHLIHRMEWQT
jgi:class 3 adenylate cyclase